MSNSLIMILLGIFCITAIVTIRLLAKMDNIVGRIFRGWWNLNFKLAAHIPFCGWMAHFIIADTDAERAAKRRYIQTGEQSDEIAAEYGRSQIAASAVGQIYGNGSDQYEVVSTYGQTAVLRDCNTGNTFEANLSDLSGNFQDSNGNTYTRR